MANNFEQNREFASETNTSRADALAAVRAAIDADSDNLTASRPVDDEDEPWPIDVDAAAVIRASSVDDAVLDMVIELLPEASLDDDTLARLVDLQLGAQREARLDRDAERSVTVHSPGALLRSLREAAAVSLERTAEVFGISTDLLGLIESTREPWYAVAPDSLPTFAVLVRVPLRQLVASLRVSAKRSIIGDIERRARHALGRFDETQEARAARTDTLRLAFARMDEENHAAARFFNEARRVCERTEGADGA